MDCHITKPIYRFVNEGDFIPSLLEFKYNHAGSIYFLTKDNHIIRDLKISSFKKGLMILKKGGIALKKVLKRKRKSEDPIDSSYPEHEIKTYIQRLKEAKRHRQNIEAKNKTICST